MHRFVLRNSRLHRFALRNSGDTLACTAWSCQTLASLALPSCIINCLAHVVSIYILSCSRRFVPPGDFPTGKRGFAALREERNETLCRNATLGPFPLESAYPFNHSFPEERDPSLSTSPKLFFCFPQDAMQWLSTRHSQPTCPY